jgi:hypothetical protein
VLVTNQLPANRAAFYLPPGSPYGERIWVVEGRYPLPDWPCAAEVVFVLDPPPLDFPLVARDWPAGRWLVLVSPRESPETGTASPLHDLLGLPAEALEGALTWLRQQPSPVFFLSFERRVWFGWLIPRDLRDRYRIVGAHHDFYLDGYRPHRDSLLFDDGYRRLIMGTLTFAQSCGYFLRVLEDLAYTPDPPEKKRMLFQAFFHFYASGARVAPDVRFDWRRDDECQALAVLHQSVASPSLAEHSTEYALAVCALSEIAACFTHSGRGDLYAVLMGDLARFDGSRLYVATALTPEQRKHLYRDQPNLYLHLSYRVANQCLVATLDALGTPQSDLLAAGDELLARLQSEEALCLSKRDHEITALAGTLCQLHTFVGRHREERAHLRKALDRGRLALERARPFERGRDANYLIQAIVSDWVLFPEESCAGPTHTDECGGALLREVRQQLDEVPENSYNLMVLLLAAAAEEEILGTGQVRVLLEEHQIGPALVSERFAAPDYDPAVTGNYALCLAAGYAALRAPLPDAERAPIERLLAAARHFFFEIHAAGRTPKISILGIVGLKLAACDLFFLGTLGHNDRVRERAMVYLTHARTLGTNRLSPVVPSLLEAAAAGRTPSLADALRAVLSLPY